MKRLLRRLDVMVFLVVAALLMVYGRWSPRFLADLASAAAGFTLWMIARRQLGTSFSARPEARALVTTGLYAKIRDPIYLSGQLAYLGLAIAWGKPAGFVFVSLLSSYRFSESERSDIGESLCRGVPGLLGANMVLSALGRQGCHARLLSPAFLR